MIKAQQAFQNFGVGEGSGPAIGCRDRFVELAVGVRQPCGAGVVRHSHLLSGRLPFFYRYGEPVSRSG